MASSSTSSLKQIPVSKVLPGMYLVRIVDSWWKSPFFLHRRILQNSEEVQLLIQSGIQMVEIDVGRGRDVQGEEATTASLIPEPATYGEAVEIPVDEEAGRTGAPLAHEPLPLTDSEIRKRAGQLRMDMRQSLDDMFQGLKTGNALPMAAVHQVAERLIREVSDHPIILTEVMLLEHLEVYDKTLHAHVLDVAILSLLVGMHLDLPGTLLHELAVAGLLHDVGFLRLPANVVMNPVGDRTVSLPPVLRQHVNVGVALIRQHAKGSSLVHRLVGEHHECVDGSGFPRQLVADSISEGGQLLGLVDYFDELVSAWGSPNRMPPALALRRIFQEVRDGRFPSRMGEALVRTLGVFPVGTVVKLSSGDIAVVASHQPQAGAKPVVLVVQGADGQPLDRMQEWDLAADGELGLSVTIQHILKPGDVAVDWQTIYSEHRAHS